MVDDFLSVIKHVFLCSRSSSRPPYYPREADSPPKHVREVPRVEHHESKCTNICSRRGKSGTREEESGSNPIKALLIEAAVSQADSGFSLSTAPSFPL